MYLKERYEGRPAEAVASSAVLNRKLTNGLGAISAIIIRALDAAGAQVSAATFQSEVDKLRLIVDNVPYWSLSPAQLDAAILDYYGESMANRGDCAVLPMVPEHLESPKTGEAALFGTEGVGDITVEVTCGTIVTIAAIEVYTLRAQVDFTPGVIRSVMAKSGVSVNATGELLTHDDFAGLAQIEAFLSAHVLLNTGTLDKIGLEVNSAEVIQAVDPNILKAIAPQRTYSASYAQFDVLVRDLMEDQLAVGGIQHLIAPAGDSFRARFNQAAVRSLVLRTQWSALPTGSATTLIVETFRSVPVTK